jgi:hypothetical protein
MYVCCTLLAYTALICDTYIHTYIGLHTYNIHTYIHTYITYIVL